MRCLERVYVCNKSAVCLRSWPNSDPGASNRKHSRLVDHCIKENNSQSNPHQQLSGLMLCWDILFLQTQRPNGTDKLSPTGPFFYTHRFVCFLLRLAEQLWPNRRHGIWWKQTPAEESWSSWQADRQWQKHDPINNITVYGSSCAETDSLLFNPWQMVRPSLTWISCSSILTCVWKLHDRQWARIWNRYVAIISFIFQKTVSGQSSMQQIRIFPMTLIWT